MNKVIIAVVIFIGTSPIMAFQCNQCHSKNPKMVKMHKELGYKDCFKCHTFKGKRNKVELAKQRVTDEKCKGCHLDK